MEGISLNSDAYKKLKKEEKEPRPEWIFKVSTKPPSLVIDHMSDKHILSEKELREIMRGYLKGEHYEAVIKDEETGELVHVLHIIDLSRYTWLPKYLYKRFLRSLCEALGLIYRPEMMEAVTPVKLTPRALVRFREKTIWEKEEEHAKETEDVVNLVNKDIAALEKFFKGLENTGKAYYVYKRGKKDE